MDLLLLFIQLFYVSAFRLLTLEQLGEKHKDIFIGNYNSNLKLQKVTSDNISNFYTVVHSNKLYFYYKGAYQGFAYDVDNVKLKLMPMPLGKVQFFTQAIKNESKDDYDIVQKPKRKMKVMKWDDLIKKPSTVVKTTETKKVESLDTYLPKKKEIHMDASLDDDYLERRGTKKPLLRGLSKPPLELPNDTFNRDYYNREIPDIDLLSRDHIPKITSPHDLLSKNPAVRDSLLKPQLIDYSQPNNNEIQDYKNLVKNLYEIIKNPKEQEKIHKKMTKDIESDSEMVTKKSLDIFLEVVNNINKTFIMKNDNNLCVTYFKNAFLLAECTNSKRQVFKLIKAEEVSNSFPKAIKEASQKDNDDIFDDIDLCSEENNSKSINLKISAKSNVTKKSKRKSRKKTKSTRKSFALHPSPKHSDNSSNETDNTEDVSNQSNEVSKTTKNYDKEDTMDDASNCSNEITNGQIGQSTSECKENESLSNSINYEKVNSQLSISPSSTQIAQSYAQPTSTVPIRTAKSNINGTRRHKRLKSSTTGKYIKLNRTSQTKNTPRSVVKQKSPAKVGQVVYPKNVTSNKKLSTNRKTSKIGKVIKLKKTKASNANTQNYYQTANPNSAVQRYNTSTRNMAPQINPNLREVKNNLIANVPNNNLINYQNQATAQSNDIKSLESISNASNNKSYIQAKQNIEKTRVQNSECADPMNLLESDQDSENISSPKEANPNDFKRAPIPPVVQPQFKTVILPKGFELHCTAMLTQNKGRRDLLPPGCENFYGPPMAQPLNYAMKVAAPVPAPRPPSKVTESTGLNLIARLENELR